MIIISPAIEVSIIRNDVPVNSNLAYILATQTVGFH